MAALLLGCEEPRVWTPPLQELTPETSDGFACIFFAENVLGVRLMPWQKWLLIHALELNADGTYRFRTVLLLVARQNGKTLILQVLALWHIYAKGSPTVIGTAQDLKNSVKTWAETVAMAQANPELAVEIGNVVQQRGDNALVLHSGEQYKVAVAGRRGARGFSGDLILLDELREHQTWDAWAAATKTTLARPKAQVWAFSNAGDFLAVVLRYLRAVAHQALGWPDGDDDKSILDRNAEDDVEDADGDTLGIFEWSMDPLLPRWDRNGWAQANPSMNQIDIAADVITERAIASARRTDPPQIFDCEVLCRWPKIGEGGPFPVGRWSATQVGSASFTGDRIVLAVDVSWDRSKSYIARAGFDDDGIVLDIAFADRGTDGVVPWLVKNRDRYSAVTLQGNGAPVSSLLDDMEAAGLPVTPCTASDLGKAWGVTWDLVDEPEPGREAIPFKHLPHPGLDLAASTAALRKIGDVVVIDRKDSPHDAAPLVAATEALWLLGKPPVEVKVPTVHEAPTEEEIEQWAKEDLL